MLSRGLRVLQALAARPQGARLSTLSQELRMPVTTTRRLLHEMLASDFVYLDEERRAYSLGLAAFELSHRVAIVQALRRAAGPVLRRIVDITGEQVLLGIRHDVHLVYVDKVDGPHQVHNHVEIGHRGPLACTALGKALLAALPAPTQDDLLARLSAQPDLVAELAATRRRGYAINEEEHEVGVRSVAVRVAPAGPCPPSAVCVTAPVFRRSRQDLHRCVPLLVESVEHIRQQLVRETVSSALDASAGDLDPAVDQRPEHAERDGFTG
jgi:DNA-binding IclR family transcriptional regulator